MFMITVDGDAEHGHADDDDACYGDDILVSVHCGGVVVVVVVAIDFGNP